MIIQNFNHEKPQVDDGFPRGWFDEKDIETYRNFYGNLSEKAIAAEVGVWQGRSICSVSDIILSKGIRVYAVDTFKGSASAPDVVHSCGGQLENIFQKNIAEFGLVNNVIIFKGKSVEVSREVDSEFDLVFIDGDHVPNSVWGDLAAWFLKVKKGGILAGHDYLWVENTVKNFFQTKGLEVHYDNHNIFWVYILD